MAKKYVIEVCGKHNETLMFAPLHARVRGRLDSAHVQHIGRPVHLAELFTAAPVIPGQYIMVDADKMEGHIFDPLRETPDGQKLWQSILPIIEKYPNAFQVKTKLREPEVHKLSLNAENGGQLLKDWLWAMARAVQSGVARPVEGKDPPPSLEEIAKMPGKRTRDCGNTGAQEKDLAKYVDVVPVGKGQGQPAA